jgi:hypothetical protein
MMISSISVPVMVRQRSNSFVRAQYVPATVKERCGLNPAEFDECLDRFRRRADQRRVGMFLAAVIDGIPTVV